MSEIALKELLSLNIPQDRIATVPARPRDSAKLLLIDRAQKEITNLRVADLPSQISCRNLLVMNNSRVLKARLI